MQIAGSGLNKSLMKPGMLGKGGNNSNYIYTEEDIAAAKARIDYDLINSTFETTFIFTNYLVATNIPKEFLPAR